MTQASTPPVVDDKPVVISAKQFGVILNTLTDIQERFAGDTDLEKRFNELNVQVSKQAIEFETQIRAIASSVSESASHAKSMVDQVGRISNVRAELDPEALAGLERRVGEMLEAKLADLPGQLSDSIVRSVQPRLVQMAGQTFEGAIAEFRAAKPGGQGMQIGLAVINALCGLSTAVFLYAAMKNATPDKFRVEGESGTTIKDSNGRTIASIG